MPNLLLKLLVSWALVLANPLVEAAPSTEFPYELIIIKSKRLLIVKKGRQIIKRYHAAFGRGGVGGKRVEGDKHTPEGNYEVVGFWPSHKFHYFIHLDYPSRGDALVGYKKGLISRQELLHIYRAQQEKNGIPPQQTRLGGFIGIHGIGVETRKKLMIHRNFDWTRGCVALTNTEIDELRQFIQLGTPVTILNGFDDKDLLAGIKAELSVFLTN
ncbi:L,D-transpeptidase family protein [Nitrosococcus watsonii]|uniref:ErfK/YbiS/YcfS/YnhG family protein n=1 Tax=Nitrosococcus watsoni (strain C-113) TaxID=105559 RepID=D8K5Z7_NITWC|nr:L,D-transpeptidase [Nitrosococcus watsonii]ADJ28324.1 ErfK/YbiS/YcfS/YnhG family protein [Nitrosococcus watsonii C-113]